MRPLTATILVLAFSCSAFGQTYTINTFAGGALPVNIPGTSASLYGPNSVAVDNAGNLYFGDEDNVMRLDVSTGMMTLVAGNAYPTGVTLDAAGNLYIADYGSSRIRKVSNGVITTVAGNGTQGYSGDNGPATSAALFFPSGIAVDAAGNLYIADTYNHRIRKVSNGVITTVAGNGTGGYSGDGGPATSAELKFPQGVTVDASGNLYIADLANYRIRKVSNGVIITVAGNGTYGYSGDNGPATSAQLNFPDGVAMDVPGNLYIADGRNNRIREVSNGVIATVAGTGTGDYSGDGGPATSAKLYDPVGVAVDAAGNLYIADLANYRIRKVSNGVITTVAGNGTPGYGGDNGPATSAQLNVPEGVTVDAAGNLYIADRDNNRVRKVANGVITTIAGNGTAGYSGDGGPAISAELNGPLGIAVDAAGNIYIADYYNNRIRKVSNGAITTVAGGGSSGLGENGPATNAQFNGPYGVAIDALGNLYIADHGNYRIRKVSGGVITTVAGNGTPSDSGDGGPATSAELVDPEGVAVDSSGEVYVADSSVRRVRVLIPSGPSCSYSVTPSSLVPPLAGGSFTVGIQTSSSCAWAVQSLPGWITLSGNAVRTGPGTVTLSVAADPGLARDATVSIAGASVQVNQQGSVACTYALSIGGQSFPVAGGTASVNVATTSGCSWTASSTLSWVTVTGGASGAGSGTVAYQVAANTGAPRSGTLTVAGLPFTVDESGTVTGLVSAGSIAQVASGGLWNSTITLVNTGTAAEQVRLNFFADNGSALSLPLIFPQTSSTTPLMASTLDETINAGAELLIQTAGTASQATQEGWVQLLATGSIGGSAIFAWTPATGEQEAVSPVETRNPNAFVLSFDNTGGYATGVALANVSNQAVSVPVVLRDDTGASLGSAVIKLAADAHTSFMLTDPTYGYAATAGKRGTLEVDTPSGGQISAIGIRADPDGAITSTPVIAK